MIEKKSHFTRNVHLAEAAAHRANNRYPTTLLNDPKLGAKILDDQETIHLCEHDKLTDLENRHSWERSLYKQLRQFHRLAKHIPENENLFFTITLIDFDDFKNINDRHGHPAGDHVLQQSAQAMIDLFRKTDTLGRFGGDEFIQFGISIAENADSIMQEFQNRHQRLTTTPIPLPNADQNVLVVTAQSWGQVIIAGKSIDQHTKQFAPTTNSSDSHRLFAHHLIHLADTALYEAKDNGKNQIRTKLLI